MRLLDEIGHVVRSPHDTAVVAQSVVDRLEALDYQNTAVLLLTPNKGLLEPLALARRGGSESDLKKDFDYVRALKPRAGRGLTGWVAQSGATLLLDDVRRSPLYWAVRDDLRSELCVGVQMGGRPLGVLNVESRLERAYGPDDARFLELVAMQLAASLHANQLTARRGFIIVCCYCRKALDKNGEWLAFEHLLHRGLALASSHGICPTCAETQCT